MKISRPTSPPPSTGAPGIRIATLGCKVNQADAEGLAAALVRQGFRIARPGDPAAVCVINTCAVTHVAETKARKLIRGFARSHPDAAIIITGCGAERIAAEINPADSSAIIVPNGRKDELPGIIAGLVAPLGATDADFNALLRGPRPARPGAVRAFVKVQDGCDHHCAYCIVPQLRGEMRSRPPAEVIAEIEALASAGAREAVICGIRLGAYGEEPRGRGLARLLHAARQAPVARLRLSSIEPWEVGEELVAEMAEHPLLCAHLHLPLQSGDDDVLRRMGRPYDMTAYAALVERLRQALPGISITTDVMVGFPGESQGAFEQTCLAIGAIGFARVHVFRYSRRPCTRAADMPQQVPEALKTERAGHLALVARQSACAYASSLIGRVVPVLIERHRAGVCTGLTDSYVRARVPGGAALVGGVVQVMVQAVDETGTLSGVRAGCGEPGCAARVTGLSPE